MTRKTERLNRLVIQSPCAESWEAMSGAGATGAAGSDSSGRFCPRCNKHVHDLAAMEAREVEALVAATRGRFCARITRDRAGRLVTRQPAAPVPALAAADPARRSSPVAAMVAGAVVGAMVGLSGAAGASAPGPIEWSSTPRTAPPAGDAPAAPAPPPPSSASPRPGEIDTAGAALTGQALDEAGAPLPGVTIVARDTDRREHTIATRADGWFTFEGLPAGTYTVEGALDGFAFIAEPNLVLQPGGRRQIALTGQAVFDDQILTGVVDIAFEEPLLAVFRDSRLVVIATVGPSVPLSESGTEPLVREVRTELQVTTVLKGTMRGSTVRVNRFETSGDEGGPQVGDTVLAFLTPAEAGDGRSADAADAPYVTVDSVAGLRHLPADALRAYRQRIEALARLGETPRADKLVEWLVATTEDEHTRKEAVSELESAVDALAFLGEQWERRRALVGRAEELDARTEADRLVAQAGAPADEVEPAVLAALLTPAHRERLSRALLATDRLTGADIDLYELVRPWTGEAATRWLARQLAGEPEPDATRRAMAHLIEELADEGLQKLLDQADAEIGEAYDQVQGDWDEAETERLGRRIEAIEHELRRKFLRALQSRP